MVVHHPCNSSAKGEGTQMAPRPEGGQHLLRSRDKNISTVDGWWSFYVLNIWLQATIYHVLLPISVSRVCYVIISPEAKT